MGARLGIWKPKLLNKTSEVSPFILTSLVSINTLKLLIYFFDIFQESPMLKCFKNLHKFIPCY